MSHALRVRFDKCIKIIWKYQFVLLATMEIDLTDNQIRFCKEYIFDCNGTRAYMAAYKGVKKESTAAAAASRLLRNVKIKDYIKDLQSNLSEMSGVTPLRNLLVLKRIAYTSLADLKDDWSELKDWNELTKDQKCCLSEIVTIETKKGDVVTTTTKIKVHNPKDYIAEMNKMIGAYPAEKVEVTGKNGGAIVVNNIDDETLLEEIEKYKMICDNTEGK